MITFIKKMFKWSTAKTSENKKNQTSLILAAFIGILEDVLFWKKMWISLSFIFILNVIFFVCVYRQINFLKFVLCICIATMCVDAFEAWLKHKHRTTCLKRLADHQGNRLKSAALQLNQWIVERWTDFLYLRENNHTKAFLLLNINFGLLLLIGKYVNGYTVIYILCMFVCISYKIVLPMLRTFRNIQQDLESECEYEGLIPEVSDIDIKLLSIEPEHSQTIDEKQNFDYWKPVDVPLEEGSDSSENSSSLVTSFSMDKLHTLEKDVETSDSSEDEYIPLEWMCQNQSLRPGINVRFLWEKKSDVYSRPKAETKDESRRRASNEFRACALGIKFAKSVTDQPKKPLLQSTLEVVDPASTWSSSTYSAFWNLTGAVTNIMQSRAEINKRKRVSSIDSSDGFEMIDKNDFT